MLKRIMTSRWLAVAVVAVLALVAPQVLMALPVAFAGTTTTTSLDQAMKVIFADPLVNNVVSDSELMSIFQTDMNVKEDPTTGGRYIENSHYFQLPAGVGARLENEYIPNADPPVFVNSRVFLKKVQGTVEMTGDVMRRVTSNEGAFLDYLDRALPDLSTRLVNECDRMYIGFGAGVKARVASKVSFSGGVGVYGVDRSLGITGYEDPFLQFLEGERIVFTGSLSAPITLRNAGSTQSGRITNIDEDLNRLTVSLDTALDSAIQVNDFIAAGDAAGNSLPAGNPSVEKEIHGLLGAVDNGGIVATYMNIARSSNRLWNAIVVDASAAPWNGLMTEDLLTYADDETAVRGGGKVDVIVMSRSAARGYWKSLKSDRFFVDPRSYTGGAARNGLSIILGDRTLMLKVARKLPPQVVFGLQSDTFRRFTLGTWEWDDRTGSIWNRVTDATGRRDAYYAVGNMYEQLFCMAPRKNFRIDGLIRVQ